MRCRRSGLAIEVSTLQQEATLYGAVSMALQAAQDRLFDEERCPREIPDGERDRRPVETRGSEAVESDARRREANDEAMAGRDGDVRARGGGVHGGGGDETPSPVDTAASASHEPVTIEMWSAWTSRRELEAVRHDLRRRSTETYPWITVKSIGDVDDTKMIAAINSGTPPDAVLSFSLDNVGKFCQTARGRT